MRKVEMDNNSLANFIKTCVQIETYMEDRVAKGYTNVEPLVNACGLGELVIARIMNDGITEIMNLLTERRKDKQTARLRRLDLEEEKNKFIAILGERAYYLITSYGVLTEDDMKKLSESAEAKALKELIKKMAKEEEDD